MADHDWLLPVVAPSWSLGHRRPVQLTEFLWVGAVEDSQSAAFLNAHGITHVLNCADYVQPPPLPLPDRPYMYLQLFARDEPTYALLDKHMTEASAFLDKTVASAGVALVHCAAGMNRSVAIAAAYLHTRFGVPVKATAGVLGRYRPVLTNSGFRAQLCRL